MANYIGNQPLNGEFKVLDSIESQFNNSSTSFGLKYNTASQTVGDAAQLIVSLNGVIQQPLTSYTLSGVTNIVFASPPANGDTCFIILLGGIGGTVTPSDNSVTTEKLTNSSVTSAKIVNNTITADDMDSSDSYAFAGVTVGSTFVTDTVNDRIGVGTTNPTYPLDVEDDGAGFIKGSFVSTGSAHSTITFDNTGSAAASVRVGSNNDDFYVRTSGSEKLRVTSAGNVGIGETSPAYPLDINGGTENVVVRISSTDADALMVFEDNSTTDRVLLGAQGEDFLLRTDLGKFTFRVNNNATDGMVILNNGNVGIGTSSPSLNASYDRVLHIHSPLGSLVKLTDDTSGSGVSDGTDLLHYGSTSYLVNREAGNIVLGTSGTERMRIDSSGNLILKATSDAGNRLQINGADETSELLEVGITTGHAQFTATNASGGSNTAGFIFRTRNGTAGTNEKMRLDAAGNLLVGTTVLTDINSSGTGNEGAFIQSYGHLGIAVSNDKTATFNRKTSDGVILEFRKDGTTVGSIGANAGDLYIGEGDTGLKFDAEYEAIVPFNTSTLANRDGEIDLGYSTPRFKDLYLSGGVYLGGTGSANKLTDVEYGTQIVYLWGTTNPATQVSATLYYTKVNDQISFQVGFESVDTTGYAGDMRITGLPFANTSGSRCPVNAILYNAGNWSDTLVGIISSGSTTIDIMNARSGNTWTTVTHSAGTSRYIWVSGSYKN